MCGIALIIGQEGCDAATIATLLQETEHSLSRRGPDSFRVHSVQSMQKTLYLAGAVLHIQGENILTQPHVDEEGNTLLWNGEVFDSLDGSLSLEGRARSGQAGVSDTSLVAKILQVACAQSAADGRDEAVAEVLANIHGPFAFIYFHASSSRVFYGRDPFGRRSLLCCREQGATQWLASVSISTGSVAEEVSIEGVHVISVGAGGTAGALQVDKVVPYPASRLRLSRQGQFVKSSFASEQDADEAAATAGAAFKSLLTAAVQRRVDALSTSSGKSSSGTGSSETATEIAAAAAAAAAAIETAATARIGVLFSGGVDSVLLAALLHECLPDPMEPIDLINVTFFGETDSSGVMDDTPSPDRLASISALVELETLFPSRRWNLVHVDVPPDERLVAETRIRHVISPSNTHMDLNIGTAFWFASRAVGYTRHYTCDDQVAALSTETGGRPLLRLGSEGAARGRGQKSVIPSAAGEAGEAGDKTVVKDRESCDGAECRKPVKKGCSNGKCGQCCLKLALAAASNSTLPPWHCNVHKHKKQYKAKAVAETEGETEAAELLRVKPATPSTDYSSACRVLIVGIGADEQMAGYGRHRTTFLKGGESALAAELEMDLNRLHTRNLGRDDRCMSDHGREAWFPYLDEGVVAYLHSLSLREIANLGEPLGSGDKMILRRAAKALGLTCCTELVKRAVQFGTRIAKHTNIREHGSNRKGSGETKI